MKFSALSPFAKLAVWVLAVVALAVGVQAVAWLVGSEFNVLRGRGRSVLLGLALASLFAVMSADRRSASEFGLFVGPIWKKLLFGGMAVGIATYAGYLLFATNVGVFSLRTDAITPQRCLTALLAAMTALPLAITEQIMFSGYLLTVLRDRYSRTTAVLVPALLFAALTQIHAPAGLLAADTLRLVAGTFLAATLLGILRILSGTVLLPAGLLAGWLFVARLAAKLGLLAPVAASPWFSAVAPLGDPRRGALMWVFLGLGIVGVSILLWRRGEWKIPHLDPSLDTDFKRVFPLSNAKMLAPLDLWISQLIAARFRVGLVYLPRLIAILILSTVNTIIALPERLLVPLLIRRRRVCDPVFLVGVHRGGTTHLHNLLSLDPQFYAPQTYQTMNPTGFLFSGWLLAPLLGVFMPWRRPMDAVRFHLFAPQEDEFAVACSCRLSPWWGMSFPKGWGIHDRYIFIGALPEAEKKLWQRHYLLFVKKLTLISARRPLLKNPYNTGRVAVLHEMFPEAKFIHLCRDPHDVYRSNIHMARQGHIVHQLQDPDESDSYETRFLKNYRAMEEAFERDTTQLSRDHVVRLRFEDLERDPIGEIRRIYKMLGLEFTVEFEARLSRYLEGIADYRKNRHQPLTAEAQQALEEQMGAFRDDWGYAAHAPYAVERAA